MGMPNDSTSSEESELVSDEEFADNSVKRVSADRGKPKRKKLTLARRIQLAKLMKRKRPSKQPPTEISQIFQPSTSVPKKPLAIRVDVSYDEFIRTPLKDCFIDM